VYQTYQQPVYQGTNTQDQYNFNPNAPTNMNLYGTGYASKAIQPGPQSSIADLNEYYRQLRMKANTSSPVDHSRDFVMKSDNGGPIDQSMNVAFGTQNKTPTSSTPYPFR
jgi:hypothetical protein